MKVDNIGINLIKKYEGFSSKPYKCPAGVWTIGYGNTYYQTGKKVGPNDKPISVEEATKLLEYTVNEDFATKLSKLVYVELSQNQINAICSLAYNIGSGAFGKSTLLKKVNSLDFGGAALEFEKWAKAGGTIVQGLLNRRREEKALFEKDIKRDNNG